MSRQYILLPHIAVHNANAMSSTYTVGFPAMTAWLGAFHRLERELRRTGCPDLRITGAAVSCENFRLHQYRKNKFVPMNLVLMGYPAKADGTPSSFIAEARCDMKVSFILRTEGIDAEQADDLKTRLLSLLARQKLAGGDIVSLPEKKQIQIKHLEGSAEERKFMRRLMPGFVLVERKDLFEALEGDDLDKLLTAVSLHAEPVLDETTGKIEKWMYRKNLAQGWVVPIAVGYRDLSGDKALRVANQRDMQTEHHFVEPLVTLGEFKMAYRFERIEEILWVYHYDQSRGLYECVNDISKES